MKSFKMYFAENMNKVLYKIVNNKEHYWPHVMDWNVIDKDKSGIEGSEVIILRDELTGVMVKFDGVARKYDFEYWGRKVNGKFTVKNLQDTIREIQKQLPGIKSEQIKSLPKIAGFKLRLNNAHESDNIIIYEKNEIDGKKIIFTVFRISELMAGGRGEIYGDIGMDNGFEKTNVFHKRYVINDIKDLAKTFKQFMKDAEKGN